MIFSKLLTPSKETRNSVFSLRLDSCSDSLLSFNTESTSSKLKIILVLKILLSVEKLEKKLKTSSFPRKW